MSRQSSPRQLADRPLAQSELSRLFDGLVQRRGTNAVKWDTDEMADDVIPLWVADMDFQVAAPIVEALQRRVSHGVFGYTHVPESFFEATIGWFSQRHGWTIDRRWMLYTSGVVPALSVVVKALTMPGDEVIVQTPVYNCFFSSIRNNGCQVVESALRRVDLADGFTYEMDFDDLEQKCQSEKARLLVICNPHNPAGRLWRADELRQVADICQRHGVVVVSDEIHCELVQPGLQFVPFGAVSSHVMDGAVVLNSPSKSFNTAGLQVANIICANDSWRRRINRAININEVCDVNPFGVEALMAAYNECGYWIDGLNSYLRANYEALVALFAECLPRVPVCRLEATYLVWIDISATGLCSDELTRRLLDDARVLVNSGTMYGRHAGEGYLRINIACPRLRLMEGLTRIANTLAPLL